MQIFQAFIQNLLIVNLLFNQTLLTCGANLDDSTDSGKFSVTSSFNLKGLLHMHGLLQLCKGRTSFCTRLISRKFCGFLLALDWLYFLQCHTSFSYINHFFYLYARFLILFHLTLSRFSQSTHLLPLSLETLTTNPRTG